VTLGKFRVAAVIAGGLLLASCSSVIRITPCRDGSRLAFEIPKVREYGFFKRPRPIHRIAVYKQGSDLDLWFTEDRRDKHDRYSLIPYGAPLKDWTVDARPTALQPNETYRVMIVGNRGDAGDIEFKPNDVVAQCSALKMG
jgi:hypothetical protein